MSPTEVGRRCAACQTQVIDFTRMTDGEVVAFVRQYSPVRRCGRFREDQAGRPLLAAAQPIAGWRRWAGAAVLLLGSVVGMKTRAQGTKPGPNARAMRPAATSTTYAGPPDSLLLVQGVVSNWWGLPQARAQVKIKAFVDSTDAKGQFSILLPRRLLSSITYKYITATLRKPNWGRTYMTGRVPFDSVRTRLYRIKMHKTVNRNPGFF